MPTKPVSVKVSNNQSPTHMPTKPVSVKVSNNQSRIFQDIWSDMNIFAICKICSPVGKFAKRAKLIDTCYHTTKQGHHNVQFYMVTTSAIYIYFFHTSK